MAVALSMRLEGRDRVEQQLRAIASGVADRRELMEGIGLYLESSTLDRFDQERAPDGSSWTPSLRAKEEGGKTLTDHAILRGSITSNASNDSVEWGSNLIYARPHQLGRTGTEQVGGHKRRIASAFGLKLKSPVEFEVDPFSRKVNLPARPFLGINGEDERQIVGLAEDYVVSIAPEARP
ncbi:MAG TPA: phage virion morphogenesis protein [Sphingobium sp.]